MGDRIVRGLSGWWAFLLAGVWLSWLAFIHFWPTGYWFEVRRVAAFDAPAGAEVLMDVDRTIHREFIADWSAIVRRWDAGAWTVECVGRGKSDYRPESAFPDPLTLRWWTDGACPSLRPGRYFISTLWTIRGNAYLPDKIVQTESNVFTITE